MKDIITEITSASIKTAPVINNTEDVVLQYENKINQSIASKTLISTKNGRTPVFTDEEIAYLMKKAIDNHTSSEVNVITPDPTITLKKGNTEINIKNAATLVKKMEDLYPKGMTEDTTDYVYRQPVIKDIELSLPPPPPSKANTINKNAYEIRTEVLGMALDWIKFKMPNSEFNPNDEDVLTTAQKFYKFVENRR